jgi:SHS family lactate transporter-like MFS transporter
MHAAHSGRQPAGAGSPPQPPPDHRPALLAGFLGWTLDAFDFFLVVLCLTAIGKDFGKSDVDVALSLTLTLAFRPVGALIFGLIADRYGRRLPLMIDLVFFSIIEVLTGLAPNFTTFLVLRALYGIGMGAEWGVGATLAMEKAPRKLRGILSGILQEGYAFGYLLAAGCYFLIFPRFGWRPMFFVGGLPALLAVYVRYNVKESEVWEEVRHTDWRSLFGEIAANWKLALYITLLMAMMNAVSHGTQDLYPTFLQRDWHFTPEMRAALTAFSMVGAIAGGIVTGLVSDRIGRRRAIIITLVLAVVAIPMWAFAPSLVVLWIGAFVMQFMVQGAWGVIPAHITELSPDGVRGFLPGFAYQCGALIAGLVPPLEARVAEHMSYARSMATVGAVVFILAALVAGLGRERRAVRFGGSPAADRSLKEGAS